MKDFTKIEQINPLPSIFDSKQKIWQWLLWTGAIMMLLGITAILLPFVATMTIEALIAIILVVAGLT